MASAKTLYLFRHIQTKQVLQLGGYKPPKLRKDHWRPLVAVTGFKSSDSVDALANALLYRKTSKQVSLVTSPEHKARQKRLRAVDEMDLIDRTLTSLREAIEVIADRRNEKDLLALWEQPHFMKLKDEKDWPSLLKHGQLELRNNRFVTEEDKSAAATSETINTTTV
ncbi:hypothetical protein BDF20DRAFT_827917 [Mycotypha africana]|uniref:uncharacterized protein n=1 Tax=Mycotypha africana TaxID=64632 RepID=UPI0023010AF4|nr:uncharacterized protein BDF20DRAFT_827917 [Mycotypha africana]KAI8968313.1 hypothetical protein BDF20DRAFT_827917 [Mycotypha africana]